MIKLIVSDLDGTLLPYGEGRISDRTLECLSEAIDRGMTVAVSSGRTYSELCSYLNKLTERMYLISCDGAYYIKDGKLLYGRAIAPSELALFSTSDGRMSFVFHGATTNYSIGSLPAEADRFCAVSVDRIGQIKEKIYKVTSYGAQLRLPAYCGLRMHWDGGANNGAQYVNRFCDKGAALSDLQMRLMLTKFDTACIGDSGNDIAMMHNAKRSFCVGERSPELMSVCTDRVSCAFDALESLLCDTAGHK